MHGTNWIRRRLEGRKNSRTLLAGNRRKELAQHVTNGKGIRERVILYVDFSTIKQILANPVLYWNDSVTEARLPFQGRLDLEIKSRRMDQVENRTMSAVIWIPTILLQEKVKMRKRPNAWPGNYWICGLVKCGECVSTMNSGPTNAKAKQGILTLPSYNRYGRGALQPAPIASLTRCIRLLERDRSVLRHSPLQTKKAWRELRKSCQCGHEEEAGG